MSLGEKIQQLRRAVGLSQEQLARQLDVSRQSVSKWELDDAVPDIGKLVMLSELFEVSLDELVKDSHQQDFEKAGVRESGFMAAARLNFAHRQMIAGMIISFVGLVMLVLEYMFLPVFASIQKAHVDGQGFYTDFSQYAAMEPMPTVFAITGIIIAAGIVLGVWGFLNKKRLQ